MLVRVLQLHRMTEEQWYPWEEAEAPIQKRGKPWLWIGLPMLIGILLIAGIIFAVINNAFGTTRIWADVSLIFVLFPICILGFIPLLVFIGLSYGIGRLVGWLPDPLWQLNTILARVAREAKRGSKVLARPIVVVRGSGAMIEAFLRGLRDIIR